MDCAVVRVDKGYESYRCEDKAGDDEAADVDPREEWAERGSERQMISDATSHTRLQYLVLTSRR